MQKFWLILICNISLFFPIVSMQIAGQPTLQVSQVRDVVKNIEIATQIGQGGGNQINSLQDLEKIFGSNISVLSVDMTNLATQELQSIAFGGYTFIINAYNRSASVSANILNKLLPLAQGDINSICLGLFGVDSSGNLLTNLSTTTLSNNSTGGLDHFELYIFKNDKTLLGSAPQYIPLNKYYSNTQQKFIIPVFGNDVVSRTANTSNATQNLGFLINGTDVTSGTQIAYPYLICLENISGVDAPNRHLNFNELSSVLPSFIESSPIDSFYQTFESLEIIIGNNAYSFNQNSLNQSTDIAANGICADISQYTASYESTGMKFIFAAIDTNGDLLSNLSQTATPIDHYLLYIFDQNNNLIKAVYVNPLYFTDASYFKITQNPNDITVLVNGQKITKTQQYSYPVLINLKYGSDVTVPSIASINNKITLKKTEVLSSFVYHLSGASAQTASLDLSDKNSFGVNWLDSINGLLAIGETVLLNETLSGKQITFRAYTFDSATSVSSQVAQQSFILPDQLSGLTVGYKTNLSKTSQTFSFSKVDSSWIAIIPSATGMPASKTLTYKSLQSSSTYGVLKAMLGMHNNTLISVPVTSNASVENIVPGWYDSGTKQYLKNGFSLQLQQMQSGSGYFFVEDNSGISTPFNGTSGIAALGSKSSLLQDLEATIIPGGSCSMILLGFDQQGNYIPDIVKTAPHKFGLFIFDSNGNSLSSSPVIFSSDDYVGLAGGYQLKSNSVGPATFTLNGLGLNQPKQDLVYPFALQVTWKFKGKQPKPKPKTIPTPIPTPTPKIMPTPTSAQIPSNMVIPIYQGLSLTQFGCILSSQVSKSFDSNFMNTVTGKLKAVGDSVKIQISTSSSNAITATAYIKTQKIGQSIPFTLSKGESVVSLSYTTSESSEMNFSVSKIQGYQDIWLEFKIVDTLSYNLLTSLSLAALNNYISDLSQNTGTFYSLVADIARIPGWLMGCKSGFTLTLNQMNAGRGYAFIGDFSNSCSTQEFSGTSGIAGLGSSTRAYSSMLSQMKAFSNVSLALLAFDAQNNYISDIIATAPTKFALCGYDKNGTILSGFPISFSANDYVGSGKYAIKPGASSPAAFAIAGLGGLQPYSTLYPFVFNIAWKLTSFINQKATHYQMSTTNPSNLWLSVNINGTEHVLMNNSKSGLTIQPGWATEYNQMPALQQIAQQEIDMGIVFSFVQVNNAFYVYVQLNPGWGGGEGDYLCSAQLENVTTLPSTVTWSGSNVSSQTISSNQAFLIADASAHWPKRDITVPAYPWN